MVESITSYQLPRKLWDMFVGFQLTIFLGLLLPICLLINMDDVVLGWGVIFALFIIFYCSVRLGMFAVHGEKRIISMTFWIYTYIFLGITPFMQLAVRRFPGQGVFTKEFTINAFLIILMGLISYDIGRLLNRIDFRILFSNNSLQFSSYRIIDKRKTFLFSGAAILVTTFLIIWVGGLEIILLPRQQRLFSIMSFAQGDSQAKFQMIMALLRVPGFVGLLFLGALWQYSIRKKTSPSSFNIFYKLLFFLLLPFTFLVNNPISTPRFWLGAIIFSFLFTFLKWRPHRSFSIWTTIIVLSFLFIFPIADAFRSTYYPEPKTLISSVTFDPLVEKADFDSFMQIRNAVEYVKENGNTYGRQMIGNILFWVPRSLWIHKPIASGTLLAENMGYEYTNLSCPLWAEVFLDAGFFGVFFVFIIYGYLTSKLENNYLNCQQFDVSLLNVIVPFLAGYQIFMLRGSLMPAFAYLTPALLVMIIVSYKKKFERLIINSNMINGVRAWPNF